MEEDDDDFYGGGGNTTQREETEVPAAAVVQLPVKMEQDEKVQRQNQGRLTNKLHGQSQNLTDHSSRPQFKSVQSQDRTSSVDVKTGNNSRPLSSLKQESTPAPRAESIGPQITKGTLTFGGREGKDFPEVRTSKLDISTIPTWPANGKLITDLDIDADLAEHSKPWRLPGTDQTDFFNYGFDEYNWVQYCMRQQQMGGLIEGQKAEDAQMKAMLGGMGGGPPGGGGAMPPGMPPGMPAMPGMPGMEDMQRMMQQMASQGMDPTQIPFEQMMQMMSGPVGGGFGSGGNSASPAPGPAQGFQPPTGPQGGMDGYSEQQMAIMQGAGGRGGRGGRRGRGSGYW
nr:pre-mrna polyadenylation factor fip1 [Quercus suber]